MKCPVCKDVSLAMTERQGVEIDYCPQCRGIWLDRGELDRLIERAEAGEGGGSGGSGGRRERQPERHAERHAERQPERHAERRPEPEPIPGGDHHRPRRRGSFLSELFDFD
jgi:uncharacterized protein